MVRWLRWHCPPDTGFEIRALAVWGRARYLSVTEAPHNTNFHTWMGKKQFCFFQTAETGNRTPDSGVKGSGANHYPRAPALETYKEHKIWHDSRSTLCSCFHYEEYFDNSIYYSWFPLNTNRWQNFFLIRCVLQDVRLIHWTSALFSHHTQMGNDCILSNDLVIFFWECKNLGVSTWFPLWLSSDGKAMSIWAQPSGQFMYQQSVRVCWGSSRDWSSTSRESGHMWDRKFIFSWWHW